MSLCRMVEEGGRSGSCYGTIQSAGSGRQAGSAGMDGEAAAASVSEQLTLKGSGSPEAAGPATDRAASPASQAAAARANLQRVRADLAEWADGAKGLPAHQPPTLQLQRARAAGHVAANLIGFGGPELALHPAVYHHRHGLLLQALWCARERDL